jgi:hypothetical protein
MSNDELQEKANEVVKKAVDGFEAFYPSGDFRDQDLFILDVLQLAEWAGRFERQENLNNKMINRVYYIGSNEDELNSLISIACGDEKAADSVPDCPDLKRDYKPTELLKRKAYTAYLALKRIFEDLIKLERPIPKPLATYVMSFLDNDKKTPEFPQGIKNEFRNFVVRHLALVAKETGYTRSTTKNREHKSITGIISTALKGQAGSPDNITKIAKEELKKKNDKSQEK